MKKRPLGKVLPEHLISENKLKLESKKPHILKITETKLRKIIREQLAQKMPVKLPDRKEYAYNQKRYDFVTKEELMAALANTQFAGLRIVDASNPTGVSDFTYHLDGTKILPLMRGQGGELYFKVNDTTDGTYYKI